MKAGILVFVLCAVMVALAATGAPAKAPPEIRDTSFAEGEARGSVMASAEVVGADQVTLTIGHKAARQRVELSPADRGPKAVTWSGAVGEHKQRCAPVTWTAVNDAGRRELNETKVCVFDAPSDDPAVDTPPGLPLPT